MFKGIIIFESGGVQQIGEITTLQGIINTIKQILPELEKQERDRVFSTLSTEELAQLIKEREAADNKRNK